MIEDVHIAHLKSCATAIRDKVLKRSGFDAQIFAHASQNRSMSYAQQQLDQLGFACEQVLIIKLYQDDRTTVVSTADLSPHALDQSLTKAFDLIAFADHDAHHGLPPQTLKQQDINIYDLQQYNPQTLDLSFLMDTCAHMEKMGLSTPGITQCEDVGFEQYTTMVHHLDTDGFDQTNLQTYFSWYASFIAGDNQAMVRASDYTASRDYHMLQTPEIIVQSVTKQAVAQQNARSCSDQVCSILLAPRLARGFFASVLQALSGHSIYKQHSFLAGKLGEMICDPSFSWIEYAHLKGAMGSCWFDAEGVATSPAAPLVVNGRLQRYMLDCYAANKLGLVSTANAGGVHNLCIECDHSLDFDALVRHCHQGVYVTQWMGQGINLSTGDFSKGAKGFWIENGQLQYPVSDLALAGNLADMMQNMVAMSNRIDTRGHIHCGDILIKDMTLSAS